jgi:phosphoribosyl 1,2-cyclic phosphate phosphodiesterase
MRFRFLGTGTSSGIPAVGCFCPVCTSSDRRDQRLRTSATVEFTDARGQERVILLDAGPDLRLQALRARLTRCDAIFFTHNHVDHTFGLDEVRRFNAVMGQPIDIYAEQHTLDHLFRVYKHIFDRPHNVNDSFVATLVAHRLMPETPIDLHGMRIMPFRLLHGGLPILGYRIEPTSELLRAWGKGSEAGGAENPFPLAYCTDVSGIPPESWPRLHGLSTLVLDALRHRRHPTHLTIDQAVNIALQAGARQTWLVHMAHDVPHEQTDSELPEGIGLAWDELVLGEVAAGT